LTQTTKNIKTAVKELLSGKVVALPTETVYGLSANALIADSVLKIFEIKKRPQFNPLIVHVLNISEIEKYSLNIPDDVYALAEKFSPGPITFVLKKKKVIPDIVTSGLDSVALRIPSHQMFREVLQASEIPIAAPSANMFGRISPTTAKEVMKELNGKVNYVLDGGRCKVGIESTVLSFLDDRIKILRPGFITKEDIENILGKQVSGSKKTNIISPGLLKFHYAPATSLYIVDDLKELKGLKNKNIGILDFSNYNDLRKLASNFFSLLRKYDESKYDFIAVQKVSPEGLGIAINDRLEKASKGKIKLKNGELKIIKKK
jgi:L-threonylcarbamoyladenylate synthase